MLLIPSDHNYISSKQVFPLISKSGLLLQVDEFPCISRIPGELYDVTVEALSTVSGEMLTQVHLKIIVAEKNQFAPEVWARQLHGRGG